MWRREPKRSETMTIRLLGFACALAAIVSAGCNDDPAPVQPEEPVKTVEELRDAERLAYDAKRDAACALYAECAPELEPGEPTRSCELPGMDGNVRTRDMAELPPMTPASELAALRAYNALYECVTENYFGCTNPPAECLLLSLVADSTRDLGHIQGIYELARPIFERLPADLALCNDRCKPLVLAPPAACLSGEEAPVTPTDDEATMYCAELCVDALDPSFARYMGASDPMPCHEAQVAYEACDTVAELSCVEEESCIAEREALWDACPMR